MAYTPELSQRWSGGLRRIAWALEVPMTTAMVAIFEHITKTINTDIICSSCKDNSFCDQCPFNKNRKEVSNDLRTCHRIWRTD